ncbi:MAG: signal peptidase I [Candidatus Gastranaerophilales bacterium]|nr:signal peptidase I [Candidatus Gastranaerophilales bacterium]
MKINEEKIKAFLKETFETVVFVIVMVVVIRFFIGEIRWIPSASMHPTLLEGDRVFVERVTRFFSSPKRGDIMVFYPPDEDLQTDFWSVFRRLTGFACTDRAYIKRVIGLPGEKFEVANNSDGSYSILINGKPIKEPYIQSKYDYSPCMPNMYCGPLTIPDGEYFMMGDNRGNSQDSRYWGLLPKERVIGKATVLFWPVTRLHYFNQKY